MAAKSMRFGAGKAPKEDKAMEFRHAMAMKKAGVPKKMVAEEMAEARGMNYGGKVKKMAMGGPAGMPVQAAVPAAAMGRPAMTGLDRAAAMSGRTMPMPGAGAPQGMPAPPVMPAQAMKKGGKVKKMASGGSAKGWGIAKGGKAAKSC